MYETTCDTETKSGASIKAQQHAAVIRSNVSEVTQWMSEEFMHATSATKHHATSAKDYVTSFFGTLFNTK